MHEDPFTFGLGSGNGTLVDAALAAVTLAVAIGGSMLWVRWRQSKRPRA